MLAYDISNPLQENFFEKYYIKIIENDKEKLIARKDRAKAIEAYKYYCKMGLNPEWKGKWTGSEFTDKDLTKLEIKK